MFEGKKNHTIHHDNQKMWSNDSGYLVVDRRFEIQVKFNQS